MKKLESGAGIRTVEEWIDKKDFEVYTQYEEVLNPWNFKKGLGNLY